MVCAACTTCGVCHFEPIRSSSSQSFNTPFPDLKGLTAHWRRNTMAQLPDNDRKPSIFSALNPLEWAKFGFHFVYMLVVALKHATWDQAREAVHHMPEDEVPAPAKAALVVFNAGWLFLIVIIWILTHALLPFLVFSIAEDLLLLALLVAGGSVSTWFFNLYARKLVGKPAFIRSRTVMAPDQIGEAFQPKEGVRERVPEGVRREDE